ncbi:MAG TPA: putative DNA-binding protein [Bacillota bacterium]|nr:putative DNA-binding protein [Clostridiaceae bacterium]HNR04274.1 putative DNA-binding protein [Bacillota bacterium]HNT03091.1 putative DNA-binding protein [Bacillota bacterium]HPA54325.1 putative DNA-binding protein [Bacillota bacterium]HPX68528.1 putative DNA-binding protein [Bacillota bacterium]
MYDKLVQIALLFDFYGQLLTEKQIEIVDMYYNNDLSLGEISEQQGISRQGVYDTLKRAERTLYQYEEKLGLVDRFLKQKQNMEKIIEMLEELITEDGYDRKNIKDKINEIKEYIGNII